VRVCAADGCPEQVERGYCAEHAPKRAPSSRSPSSYVTGTARWRRLKARVLKRDEYVCRLGLPGCLVEATTVDHVNPVSQGGAPYDEANLVASCAPCNLRKGARRHG
jgi:5-methylcytosine-specific restriction enzyme A